MKKLLIVCITLALFVSCQDNKESTKQTGTDTTKQNQDFTLAFKNPISKDSAARLVKEFTTAKPLKFAGIINATFNKTDMQRVYSDPTVDSVFFFVGRFPGVAENGNKQKSPVIIMQIRRKPVAAVLPPPEYYLGDEYCPPPNDGTCGTLEQPSFQ